MDVELPPPVTPLGFALLAEIRRQPRGGYTLRRLFETTPLGLFSSSPGSIYPALRRLGEQGMVTAVGGGRGGRFEITPLGISTLEGWLAQPVTTADVSRRLELCLLRFAFMEAHPDSSLATDFLASLQDAAEARREELMAFLDHSEGQALPEHGRLAVMHGIRTIGATGEWAAEAIKTLRNGQDRDER